MSDIKMRLDKVRALVQEPEFLEESSVMNRRMKWLSAIL